MGAAGLELAPLPTLICSELKDQRLTSGPNCWLRRGTGACIPGGCSPQRRRVVVWRCCTTHRLCDLHRKGRIGRVVSCRNANCCARVKGAGRAHKRQKRQPGG